MHLCMIAAALPPKLDGIGDYTASLAAELARTQQVSILVGQGRPAAPIPGVKIEAVFSPQRPGSVRRIADRIRETRPDWVVLQYNPFSYGRWGLNLHLPHVMQTIRAGGARFALMMHEPFVPRINWKFAVMSLWQRYQFRRLGETADVIFISIDPWVRRFTPWFPRKPVVHLPVGSSIPYLALPREEARRRLGIAEDQMVLGLFGTLHAARLQNRVREAADTARAAGCSPLVLYMGPHSRAIRETMGDHALIAEGPLPPEEISRRFAALDCYLAPFVDGVSTRRTSMMTALQHGVPVAGTRGDLTDAMLEACNGEALLLADRDDAAGYARQVMRLVQDPMLRETIGRNGRRLFTEQFTWECIAARLLEHLTLSRPTAGVKG